MQQKTFVKRLERINKNYPKKERKPFKPILKPQEVLEYRNALLLHYFTGSAHCKAICLIISWDYILNY